MRFLFGALMIRSQLRPRSVSQSQIRNADRRGGHEGVELSRIVAWPAFERSAVRWPDVGAIERMIDAEWAEARR